jgi:hypothetical protein
MQSALSTTQSIPETRKEPSTNMRGSTYTHVKTQKQTKRNKTNKHKQTKTDQKQQQKQQKQTN